MTDRSNMNLWGGRFESPADETFARFNRSFDVDKRLFRFDVLASRGHCEGLRAAGVLSDEEATAISGALEAMLTRADSDARFFDGTDAEDVHTFIEAKLIEGLGETGRKIHTGRSRNDQVSTAFRMWLRAELALIEELVRALQGALVDVAEAHAATVLPGYTHLQRAQPVSFAHWCLAYFEMLARDRERISEAARRTNVMPLGSAALAGTSYPVDREAVAQSLGFAGVSKNSLDAVSDRDFAVDAVGACSLVMMHLSRFAEDVIVYSSVEFGLLRLGDAVSTGSSLMPQKKNPDALELIRGKSARVFGHHAALLALMKGLPLAYNKDMQEDKEAVFDAVDTVAESLRVAAIVVSHMEPDPARCMESATNGYLNATELADYLVAKGVPFRTAHDLVGRIVLHATAKGCELQGLSLDEFKGFSELIEPDVYEALGLSATLGSKSIIGGTSPSRVAEALAAARGRMG